MLESQRRKHGAEHSDTIGAMVNLASALRDMGKLDQAEPLYRQALETARRVLPGDDRRIPQFRSAYGACLMMLSDTRRPRITCSPATKASRPRRAKNTSGRGRPSSGW